MGDCRNPIISALLIALAPFIAAAIISNSLVLLIADAIITPVTMHASQIMSLPIPAGNADASTRPRDRFSLKNRP